MSLCGTPIRSVSGPESDLPNSSLRFSSDGRDDRLSHAAQQYLGLAELAAATPALGAHQVPSVGGLELHAPRRGDPNPLPKPLVRFLFDPGHR